MTNTLNTTRFAAAALIALGALSIAATPAFSKEARTSDGTLVDTRTTGSIATAGHSCDPTDPHAGFVCRIKHGDRDAQFPSAPINPSFGF